MTYLLLEVFGLMVVAFLLGAILACLSRRLLFSGAGAAEPVETFEFVAPAKAAPQPVSGDRVSASDRFARALTSSGTRPVVAPIEPVYPPAQVAATPPPASATPAPVIPAEVQPKPEAPKPEARTDFTPVAAAAAALERARAAIGSEQTSSVQSVLSRDIMPGLIVTPRDAAPSTAPVAVQPPAPQPEPDAPPPVEAPPVPAATAAAIVEAIPTSDAPRDDLTKIRAITATTEQQLNELNVYRFEQIARWTSEEVELVNAVIEGYGRVERENWIEQAAILAKGQDTAYSRARAAMPAKLTDVDAGDGSEGHGQEMSSAPTLATSATAESTTRPARLADAIRDHEEKSPEFQRSARSDLGALRSIRSEALTGPDGAVLLGPGLEPDDLKRIRGIGVLVEKKLNSLAVVSYEQIADWTDEDIERISRQLDFQGRIERENWVDQARILVAERAAASGAV